MTFQIWWSDLSALFRATYCMDIGVVYDECYAQSAYRHGETPQEVCDWLGEKHDLVKMADWTMEDAVAVIGEHLGSLQAAQALADKLIG